MSLSAESSVEELMVVANIGATVLNLVSATMLAGHTNPGHTLTYYNPAPGAPLGVILGIDAIAWTGKRGDWRGSEERLRRYVHESGWQRSAIAAAAQRMGAHSP